MLVFSAIFFFFVIDRKSLSVVPVRYRGSLFLCIKMYPGKNNCAFVLLFFFFWQKMEILPVNDLDVALHEFVNKDDKTAFYSCLQYNLEETRVSSSIS